MHLFYTPDISSEQYTLNEEESKHCIRVLRMKIGSEVHLVDGLGGYYKARVAFDNPKACRLEVFETTTEYEKQSYSFHLAIAPTKNTDRLEWMVEKAVEIGISAITPIICEHSERKHINIERLERIAISAMKQSVKAYLPIIHNAVSFKEFISKEKAECKHIAHCIDNESIDIYKKTPLFQRCEKGKSVICLIGPEGDFSPAEVEIAAKAGYSGVSLGNSRLRTETAGLVACHTVYLLNS